MMFLTAFLNAVIAVITARSLGPEGRGALAIVIALVSITALFSSMGLNASGRFHLVAPNHLVSLGSYMGVACALVTLEVFVSGGIAVIALPAAGLDVTHNRAVVVALYGGTFLAGLLCRDTCNAYGYTFRAAAGNALGSAIALLSISSLSLTHVQNVDYYVLALAGGSLVEVVAHLHKLHAQGKSFRPRIERGEWITLIRRGWPSLGLTAGQSLTFRADRYILGAFAGPAVVGVYSVAATLSEMLRLIPSALGQVAFFRAASATASHRALDRARVLLLVIMAPALVVLAWLGPWLIDLLFGSEFSGAALALRILLIGELAIMSFQIDSRVITGLGSARAAGLAGMIGLATVLIADFALIPSYEMTGAAIASVVAYIAMGVAARILLLRVRGGAHTSQRVEERRG